MKRHLGFYVTTEVATAFARYAHGQKLSVSEALRELVERAVANHTGLVDASHRRLLFIETGVDALLAEHPTVELRAATHNAFQTRLKSEGLAK